jgi:hypothetical protein
MGLGDTPFFMASRTDQRKGPSEIVDRRNGQSLGAKNRTNAALARNHANRSQHHSAEDSTETDGNHQTTPYPAKSQSRYRKTEQANDSDGYDDTGQFPCCERSTQADTKVVPASPKLTAEELGERSWVSKMHVAKAGIVHDPKPTPPEPLAQVDVFTRLQTGIETAGGFERTAPHGHVACTQPFHVTGATRPPTQEVVGSLHPGPVARSFTQGSYSAHIRLLKLFDGTLDPAACNLVVGIDKREDVSGSGCGSSVPQLPDRYTGHD